MRRCFLFAALLALIAGLFFVRSHRFVRSLDEPAFELADLRRLDPALPIGAEWTGDADKPSLRLPASAGKPSRSLKVAIPMQRPIEALYVRVGMSAEGLVTGKHEWDSGRLLIQWMSVGLHDPEETDPVGSVEDDEEIEGLSMVVRPASALAHPVLHIENLGSEGDLVISALEIIPVRQGGFWEWGRWGLCLCWFGWALAFLSGDPRIKRWRICAASAIWVAMGITFAFPGPWQQLMPFVVPYELGVTGATPAKISSEESGTPWEKVSPNDASRVSEKAETLGRTPVADNWIIQTKHHLKKFRMLMHIGLISACTFVFLLLVGARRAITLSGILVIAIEACQAGFGFGFDFQDVLDLVWGAAGITPTVWLYGKLRKRFFIRGGETKPMPSSSG